MPSHYLRVRYDFLTFIVRCEIVDQVVCPALSKDYWEEVVRAVERKGATDAIKRDGVNGEASKSHQVEMETLSLLLASVLAERGFLRDDVGKPIRELCAIIFSVLDDMECARILNQDQKDYCGRFVIP